MVEDYADEKVDAFVLRCRDTGGLYWVPIDVAGRKSTYLRIEDAEIDHPAVRDADDYAFENALPPR